MNENDRAHENDRCGTCRYYREERSLIAIVPFCSMSGRSQVLPMLTAKADAVCLRWEATQCKPSPDMVLGFPVVYAERSPGGR